MSIDTLLTAIGVLAGVAFGIIGLQHIEKLLFQKQRVEKDGGGVQADRDRNIGGQR